MHLVQPNNSLINGLACLQLVVTWDKPIGVAELARELKLSTTRVSRLLSTLAHLGLVVQNSRRKYRPGPAIHVLAAHSLHASPLLSLSLPHLLKFRKDGFTVALGVLWRRHICYLFHERPSQSLEDSFGRHEVYPAERSSPGMVLLAAANAPAPEEASQGVQYLGDASEWGAHLGEIRARGFAALRYSDGEISVGVPIGKPAVAAIGISAKRLSEDSIAELVSQMGNAAAIISAAMAAE